MKRNQAILSAGAAFGALALGGRAFAADASVRIATLTIDAGASCYYAQEQGFFKRAGIDAQIQAIASGGAIVAAVASNAVDVGFANLVSVAAAFTSYDEKNIVRYDFLKDGTAWKIDDMRGESGTDKWSLREIIKTNTP